MAEEVITIIRVDTGQAVSSISDLKFNIQEYKKALADLDIGSKEYNDTLNALQVNQAALKNAMNAASQEGDGQRISMEQIAKAAYGAGESYNALVKRMAELDRQFRATEDAAERAALGKQIKEINDQLKQLDADRGKFQRNVGNYKSAVEGLGTAFGALGNNIGIAGLNLGNFAKTMQAANPIIGIISASIAAIAAGIKSSEENTNAWNHAMAAFKPIGDAFMNTIQSIGAEVADLAGKFVDLLYKWGLLDEEAGKRRQALADQEAAMLQNRRVRLVANAQLEADVAAYREKVQMKEEYTAQQRLAFLEKAQWAEQQIAKNNLANAQERLAFLQQQAKLYGNNTASLNALAQAEVEVERARAAGAQAERRILREMNAVRKEMGEKRVKQTRQELETIEAIPAAIESAAVRTEEAESYMERKVREHTQARIAAYQEEAEYQKKLNEARIEAAFGYANALSDVLGSVADIYEANGEADEAAAQKAKALRTASAIISTISGAVAAYMNTIKSIEIPAVAIPLAVANAAVVMAAGMAQVKQINAVKVGDGGSKGSAAVSAPSMISSPAQVRTITGASEEERLNQMAAKNRVYILASDLQAERDSTRVRVAETAF